MLKKLCLTNPLSYLRLRLLCLFIWAVPQICLAQNFSGYEFWNAFDGPAKAGGQLYNQNGIVISLTVYESQDPWGTAPMTCEIGNPTNQEEKNHDGKPLKYYRVKFTIQNTNSDKQVLFRRSPPVSFKVEAVGHPIAHICDNNTGSTINATTGVYKMGANSKVTVDESSHGDWFFAKPKITQWSIGNYTLEPDPAIAQQQNQSQFNQLITQADNALNNGNYQQALFFYQDALKLKPNDAYTKKQIAKINVYLKEEQKKQEEKEKEEKEDDLGDFMNDLEEDFKNEVDPESIPIDKLQKQTQVNKNEVEGSEELNPDSGPKNYNAQLCSQLKSRAQQLYSRFSSMTTTALNGGSIEQLMPLLNQMDGFNEQYYAAIQEQTLDPQCAKEIGQIFEDFGDQMMNKLNQYISNLGVDIGSGSTGPIVKFPKFAPPTMTPQYKKIGTAAPKEKNPFSSATLKLEKKQDPIVVKKKKKGNDNHQK